MTNITDHPHYRAFAAVDPARADDVRSEIERRADAALRANRARNPLGRASREAIQAALATETERATTDVSAWVDAARPPARRLAAADPLLRRLQRETPEPPAPAMPDLPPIDTPDG